MELLSHPRVIFWDFDGVIKDSVDVKTTAFEHLFRPYGAELASQVKRHHEANGGVSRFEKIPLYLTWSGEQVTEAKVDAFCARFAQSVQQAVIDAPWVPGVREYLLQHYSQQYFVLVTATPQEEIEQILAALDLTHCFREVHGAPIQKGQAIKAVMSRLKCSPTQALMIGDSKTDLEAALTNSVQFLLRRTPINLNLQASHTGPMFDDLNDE